jgi:subtilisin family serine protease
MRTLFRVAVLLFVIGANLQAQIPPPTVRKPSVEVPGVYLVTFRSDVSAAQKVDVVQASGAQLRGVFNASHAASVSIPDAAALARLRNNPRVLNVFANRRFTIEQGRGGGNGASKPKPPTNLAAAVASVSQINLSWADEANNENGFAVERCSGPNCSNFSEIFRVGANVINYADSGLAAQTLYRYRVSAFNTAGVSKYSDIVEATTPAPPQPPAAPTNLIASAVSPTEIDLNWSDNSANETGFRIERCIGQGCTNFSQLVVAVAANVTSHPDTGLTAQTTYRYRVQAFNSIGNSTYSNIAETTTPLPPQPPSAPTNLTASVASFSQINLNWTDNSTGENGFHIERCMGANCNNFAEISTTLADVTTYPNSGLLPQTLYRYRVRAFNTVGNSAYSNTAEATTPTMPTAPAAPSDLVSFAVSYNQIDIYWFDNSVDEDGFRIERCSGVMATCTNFTDIGQVGANIVGISNLGVQGGTTYTYRVRAFNAAGTSPYSNPSEATTLPAPPNTQVVPSGVQRIGAAPGQLNWTGAGVGVAVVDTGLDFSHADLGLQPEIPGVNSFNAYGGSCEDIHGHGTHVAGIIAARNNNIDVVGVAPNATIYCVNVFTNDPDEGTVGTDEDLIEGLEWIAANANVLTPRIRVVNMSLGRDKTVDDNNPNHPVHLAVKALYDLGITVVVAAGNDALREVSEEVPASYPEVMAVASVPAVSGVNGYDIDLPACPGLQNIKADTASYFTTDGAFTGGVGVTVSAPGEHQEDLFMFSGSCFLESIGILSTAAGGGVVELTGTSMSSPHVAGVVALMWEKELSHGSTLSPEVARTRIRNNVDRPGTAPLDSPVAEYSFDNEREGVIWAPAALGDAPPPPRDAPPTVSIVNPAGNDNFSSGANIFFHGTADDTEDGNIAGSLDWTSSRDGHIGTGASFNKVLTNGNHIITASVVDSGGNPGAATISINVGSSSIPTTVQFGSVVYAEQGTSLIYTVKLVDEFGRPVAGASVRASLYEYLFTGALWFTTGTTDSQGNVRFQLLNADLGCYTTGVENVVAPGLTWVPGNPSNSYCIF